MRRWFFRFLAAGGVPLLLLGVLEGLLRIGGFGHSASFFGTWRVGATNLWVDNPHYAERFFPASLAPEPRTFALPMRKDRRAFRIFVFGESAALGDPDVKFGFAPMLRMLLQERFLERRFELVNTSIVAINSHVIRSIAGECATREGDVWVIYMGNNETIGPFGSATVFGWQAPPLAVARATMALKSTRTGQLLDAIVQRMQNRGSAQSEWRGMEMFIEQKVRRDDPRAVRVRDHFRQNLADILTVGRKAGARILLCTVGTNLRDCAPFASVHRPGLTEAELVKWRAAYERGEREEAQGRWADALGAYQDAAEIDASYAELQFHLGTCRLALGQAEAATASFRQARDEDALQFRADTELSDLIRRAASAPGVHLVDVEALLAARSAGRIPGREWFYEHVHLTPDANYLIAHALADQVVHACHLAPAANPGGTETRADHATLSSVTARPDIETSPAGWLTQAECLRRLGYTDVNRYDSLNVMISRIGRPPFTGQCNHDNHLRTLHDELNRTRSATKPAQLGREIPAVREMVARHPEDPELRRNLAGLLEMVSDYAGAEAEWRVIAELLPHAASVRLYLARVLERQERQQEALQCYRECLQRDPDFPPAREKLGLARKP